MRGAAVFAGRFGLQVDPGWALAGFWAGFVANHAVALLLLLDSHPREEHANDVERSPLRDGRQARTDPEDVRGLD